MFSLEYIMRSYKNWRTIHYFESIKQLYSTDTDINVHIKQNSVRKISLNIGKDISDNDYGKI